MLLVVLVQTSKDNVTYCVKPSQSGKLNCQHNHLCTTFKHSFSPFSFTVFPFTYADTLSTDIGIYYIVITIVEHDTRKYHKFIAEYCYECEARVTIPKAMNE